MFLFAYSYLFTIINNKQRKAREDDARFEALIKATETKN